VVNIRPLKTDKGRKFVIVDDDGGIPYVQLFKKYLSLRPSNVNTDRVFLKYESGRCIRQVVGINTLTGKKNGTLISQQQIFPIIPILMYFDQEAMIANITLNISIRYFISNFA
jgi:hypothetical protein